MKNLLLVICDLVMNKGSSYRWIAALIMRKVRDLSMIITMIVLCLILISSSINMIVNDLQRSIESQHQLAMTSVSAVGFGILIFSLTAICLFYRRSVWGLAPTVSDPASPKKSEPPLEFSPLVQALTELVMDFVEERREKRNSGSCSLEGVHVRESSQT